MLSRRDRSTGLSLPLTRTVSTRQETSVMLPLRVCALIRTKHSSPIAAHHGHHFTLPHYFCFRPEESLRLLFNPSSSLLLLHVLLRVHMAIVVGDVVEFGVSDANGGVMKILGVVEHDNGDTLRVLTGCLPTPVRDIPRVSLRRVWGSAQVHWGAENTTELASVTNTIQRRARRKALGLTEGSSSGISASNVPKPGNVSSSDDLDDETADGWSFDTMESSTAHAKRPLHANPLHLLCAVFDDLCSWRSTMRSAAFLAALCLWWLTNVLARVLSGPGVVLSLRIAIQPIVAVLLAFAVLTAQPSPKCASTWSLVLVAVLGLMWMTGSSSLGAPILALCSITGLFLHLFGSQS